MPHKKLSVLIVVFCLLFSACENLPTNEEPSIATPTTKPEATSAPVGPQGGESNTGDAETPTPSTSSADSGDADKSDKKTLVVCQAYEPETLYLYGGTTLGANHIHEAIYDGPYDTRTYAAQGIIYTLPSFENGGAVINRVTVQTGDKIVNAAGEPVELVEGDLIRPAECYSATCAIEFDGTPVEMGQMVAVFKINDGVLWSDGIPLTADDSVYGFELYASPDTPVSRFTVARTKSYERLDEQTTMWTGLPGYIDDEYFLNFFHPFPRHLWDAQLALSASDLLEAEVSTRQPMGWGPFVIQEWLPGDHITLEKNPQYFRAAEGLPHIDTLIFRFVDDPNTALAQLISGECDILTEDTDIGKQADLLLELEQEGLIKPVFSPNALWEQVTFGIQPAEDYERPDFFSDVRMRQAIAYCLNRQSVAETLLHGHSTVLNSYIPPEHPLYAEDGLNTYAYDPAKGAGLLQEMGWVDTDEDGIREAQGIEGISDGTRLAFKWQATDTTLSVAYVEIFKQNLKDCGIEVQAEHLSASQHFFDAPDGPIFTRAFDIASFAWLTEVAPPCTLYLSSEIPTADNGWSGHNAAGFRSEAFDAACLRARASLPGSTAYIESHQEAQRIFSEQLPSLPLFLHLSIAATRPNVTGFILDPTQPSEMWNIEAFDLTQGIP